MRQFPHQQLPWFPLLFFAAAGQKPSLLLRQLLSLCHYSLLIRFLLGWLGRLRLWRIVARIAASTTMLAFLHATASTPIGFFFVGGDGATRGCWRGQRALWELVDKRRWQQTEAVVGDPRAPTQPEDLQEREVDPNLPDAFVVNRAAAGAIDGSNPYHRRTATAAVAVAAAAVRAGLVSLTSHIAAKSRFACMFRGRADCSHNFRVHMPRPAVQLRLEPAEPAALLDCQVPVLSEQHVHAERRTRLGRALLVIPLAFLRCSTLVVFACGLRVSAAARLPPPVLLRHVGDRGGQIKRERVTPGPGGVDKLSANPTTQRRHR